MRAGHAERPPTAHGAGRVRFRVRSAPTPSETESQQRRANRPRNPCRSARSLLLGAPRWSSVLQRTAYRGDRKETALLCGIRGLVLRFVCGPGDRQTGAALQIVDWVLLGDRSALGRQSLGTRRMMLNGDRDDLPPPSLDLLVLMKSRQAVPSYSQIEQPPTGVEAPIERVGRRSRRGAPRPGWPVPPIPGVLGSLRFALGREDAKAPRPTSIRVVALGTPSVAVTEDAHALSSFTSRSGFTRPVCA